MNMKIYALDSASGIAIVDNNSKFAALVNGKLYDTASYRPINGDGRRLRDDSIDTIKRLLPDAESAKDKDDFELLKAREAYAEQYAAENPVIEYHDAPRENFADALQAAFLSTLTEQASGALIEKVLPLAAEKLDKALTEKFGIRPVVHEIKLPERPPVEVTGRLHKSFDNILKMVSCGEPVYLVGPAGTGKSYLAQQIAKALNVEYYYTNSVTDDVQIKGFIDANGRYHETQFYRAFTQGGVFLLDEIDASIEEALILLNNALANGYFDFPTGRATAHEDFHCIAAGNTYGTGANQEYTGRYRLDAASLDRFVIMSVDYDRDIEMDISGNNAELVEFADDFRAAAKAAGISCLCTYRAIKRIAKFDSFMEKADNLRASLTKGLKQDDISFIYSKMRKQSNPWAVALATLGK